MMGLRQRVSGLFSGLVAGVLSLMEWAGVRGGGLPLLPGQPLSEMWWHFFVF
jgi:hypothetical protein